jgi:hypothetical protein
MPVVRVLRFLLLPVALATGLELLRLAVISLQQAFHRGLGEGLMMAWVLLFVVGLPSLLLAAPLAGAVGRRHRHQAIVPSLGVKIP